MKEQHILTNRLELREVTEEDTDLIVSWRSTPSIYKYFGSARAISKEEHLEWYKKYLQNPDIKHFIAVEIGSKKQIGVFGVKRSEDNIEYVEISSCILDLDVRGNGFAQEAINALVKYATEIWDVKKVIAIVHKENYASRKMFERCAFHLKDDTQPFYRYVRDICYT